MPSWYAWIWKIIWAAGVADAVLSLASPILGVLGSTASYASGREVVMPWWAWIPTGFGIGLLAICYALGRKAYLLEREGLPKLVFRGISETERPSQIHRTMRRFEIEIFNDSAVLLSDCVVNLDAMHANDGQIISTDHLPRALLTRQGEAQERREARFRLRPQQRKFVGILARIDGRQEEIHFSYEGEPERFWSFQLIHCRDLTATIVAYGAETPARASLHITIDDAGRTHVERTEIGAAIA